MRGFTFDRLAACLALLVSMLSLLWQYETTVLINQESIIFIPAQYKNGWPLDDSSEFTEKYYLVNIGQQPIAILSIEGAFGITSVDHKLPLTLQAGESLIITTNSYRIDQQGRKHLEFDRLLDQRRMDALAGSGNSVDQVIITTAKKKHVFQTSFYNNYKAFQEWALPLINIPIIADEDLPNGKQSEVRIQP